jgi:hypothetical protein
VPQTPLKVWYIGSKKAPKDDQVFKDNESKEMIISKHIESETIKDYKYLKE